MKTIDLDHFNLSCEIYVLGKANHPQSTELCNTPRGTAGGSIDAIIPTVTSLFTLIRYFSHFKFDIFDFFFFFNGKHRNILILINSGTKK